MIEGDTILSALYAVINLMISVLVGFMLAKIGVLTPVTRKVLSDVNYYALCPIYCIYFIMQAIDKDRLGDVVLILWSILPSCIISFIIVFSLSFVFKFDTRIRFSYTFVHMYANVVIMPQMLADSLCTKGAKYDETASCKNSLVKPYSSIPMIYMNILYWVTVLPLLQEEKRVALVAKKIMVVALNFYDSVDEFLSDIKTFENAKFIGNHVNKMDHNYVEVNGHPAVTGKASARSVSVGVAEVDDPIRTSSELPKILTAEDERFIDEYYQKILTNEKFKNLNAVFAEFEEKFYNKPENEAVRKQIEKEVLEPEKLMVLPKEESITSAQFYIDHVLCSPPALCSIIGLILGFIFPFNEWVFDPDHKPLPTFLGTFQTIGGMMSPVSMFMLGTYLAQTTVITKSMFLGWKHIIMSNIAKNLVIPAIGIFWVTVVVKKTYEESYNENPILIFISYTYWIVPNGILLIAVYVVADYFAKEFAVISIYMNLIALPMMIVFLILYFLIYEG